MKLKTKIRIIREGDPPQKREIGLLPHLLIMIALAALGVYAIVRYF